MTKCCYFIGYYEGPDGSFEMECYCKLGEGKTIMLVDLKKTLTYANNIIIWFYHLGLGFFSDFWDSFVK